MKHGINIRIIRIIKNISPKIMASALKMSTANYNKVENDKINLSEENLEIAARELGVSVDFIKKFPNDIFSVGHNNQQSENANFVVHPAPEKMVEMLQSTIQTMQDEIAYLRKYNAILMQKFLDSDVFDN
jgi:transcriptional regulator with XRE-family HTH domain